MPRRGRRPDLRRHRCAPPEMRHEVPVAVPDPFLYAEHDGRRVAVVTPFEVERIRRPTAIEAARARAVRLRRAARAGRSAWSRSTLETPLRACRELGIDGRVVPAAFPLELADHLRANGIDAHARPRDSSRTPPREERRRARRDPPRAARAEAGDGRGARPAAPRPSANGSARSSTASRSRASASRSRSRPRSASTASPATSSSSRTARRPRSATSWAPAPIAPDEPVVLDLWPRDRATGCYADMTRTFVVGEPSGGARRVPAARASEALDRSLEAIKAGRRRARHLRAASAGSSRSTATRRSSTKRPARCSRTASSTASATASGSRCTSSRGSAAAPARARRRRRRRRSSRGCTASGYGGCRLEDLVLVTEDGAESADGLPVRPDALSWRSTSPPSRRCSSRSGAIRRPPEFAAQANAQPDIYDRDFEEFWETEGRERVTWFEPFDRAVRVGAAVREVVPRREAQRLLQLRRPARRGRQRREGRLPLGGRARGRAADDHVLRPPARGRPLRERAEEARRRRRGRRSRSTWAWFRSCRSRCSRARVSARRTRSSSAASRPSRSPAGMNDMGCEVLITQDEAWRNGSPVPLKRNADEASADAPGVKHVRRPAPHRQRGADAGGPRRLVARAGRRARATIRRRARASRWTPRICCSSCTRAGTTAKPKGIAHTTAGYLVGVATTHHYIFDVKPDSVYWCAADIGWVTGHSYIVYGPLCNGTTGVMYEGVPDYPDQRPLVGDRRAVQASTSSTRRRPRSART